MDMGLTTSSRVSGSMRPIRDSTRPGPTIEAWSLYQSRGRLFVGRRDPETCITATIETVDDDRASSLLGVLPPS